MKILKTIPKDGKGRSMSSSLVLLTLTTVKTGSDNTEVVKKRKTGKHRKDPSKR